MTGTNENRPINCVTWFEAMAFCTWDGGFLPTEAEWNYAASGGEEHRAYPWSSPPDSTITSAQASYSNGVDCLGDGMPGCDVTDLVFVGTRPSGNGRWGHADLAGNVYEWVLDSFVSPYEMANCISCASLNATPDRVKRGGAYNADVTRARAAYRRVDSVRDSDLGFRCAREVR